MRLEITKEDIKELLEERILEKSHLAGRIKHLKEFPININQDGSGRHLRYYLYIEVHTIFSSKDMLMEQQHTTIHGSVFNTIVLHQIDKHMDNKSYYELDDLASDFFDCLNEIQEEINYITVWDE